MNLYEKLKENYRVQLEEHVTLYPTSYGMVKADLLSNEYSHNIMYNTFTKRVTFFTSASLAIR